MKIRRARFTLIELLVVIAIIATIQLAEGTPGVDQGCEPPRKSKASLE